MSNWLQASGMSGERYSEILNISNNYSAIESIVSWSSIVPSGCTLIVETNLSLDAGLSWGGWRQVHNNGFVDGLNQEGDFRNARLQYRYRYTIPRESSDIVEISNFQIKLYPNIFFINSGDKICKPEIWIIKKQGFGDIKITNKTTSQVMQFTGLENDEEIYIDCESETIETNIPLKHRYDSHNDEWLWFDVGTNILKIEGACTIRFRYSFTLLQ